MKILSNKYLKLFITFSLIFLGLFYFMWLIWARFLRERLPKEIPFELSTLRFLILFYICCIYFYIIISILYPRKGHKVIKKIIEILYMPLTTLDIFIKTNKIISPYYKDFRSIFMEYFIYNIYNFETKVFLILLYIIPRVILVSTLALDVFWYHKIFYFYMIILIGVLPLIHRYIKYNIKIIKEELILELEDTYSFMDVWTITHEDADEVEEYNIEYGDQYWIAHPDAKKNTGMKTIREWVDIQTEAKINYINEDSKIEYEATPYAHDKTRMQYRIKYNKINQDLKIEDLDIIKEKYNEIFPILIEYNMKLELYLDIDYLEVIKRFKYIKIKHLKLLIFKAYFMCWSYILINSMEKLPEDSIIVYIELIKDIIEPFSEL